MTAGPTEKTPVTPEIAPEAVVAAVAALAERMTPECTHAEAIHLAQAMWEHGGIHHHVTDYLMAVDQRAGVTPLGMLSRAAMDYAHYERPQVNWLAELLTTTLREGDVVGYSVVESAPASGRRTPTLSGVTANADVIASVRALAEYAGTADFGAHGAELAGHMLAITRHAAAYGDRLLAWAMANADADAQGFTHTSVGAAHALTRLMFDLPAAIRVAGATTHADPQ